jgi:hypothetical protein
MSKKLTQDKLKSRLSYSQNNGLFSWISEPSNRKTKGVAGGLDSLGYRGIKIDGKQYLAHRLAFLYVNGSLPLYCVDHINGDRDDNRWVNLRACTLSQNQKNRKVGKNSTSGVKGVTWMKDRSKWRADIKNSGKSVHVGVFKSLEDAEKAVIKKREELHGEFANHG